MLKKKGLKVSGRKAKLIERLIDSDLEEMQNAVKGITLYHCTSEGRDIATQYLEKLEKERISTEQKVFALLSRQEFFDAAQTVAEYEAAQVFPRGLGIDWKTYNFTSDVHDLERIFSQPPAILKDIDQSKLEPLRIAAAMAYLWGASVSKAYT